MDENQIKEIKELLDDFVTDNFIIEDQCDSCCDSAYIEADCPSGIYYNQNLNKFLIEIKKILKLNTLKGFINE